MNKKFGPAICPVCNGNVYFAEEIRSMGKAFHKCCFKCSKLLICLVNAGPQGFCNKTLDSFTANDHEDRLFCRSCYSKNFGPKIYGFNSSTANLERNFEVP